MKIESKKKKIESKKNRIQHLPREMLAIRQHLSIDNISHNIYKTS